MNQLPIEDDIFDDEIANAPNPFWTFINGQSVRVQSKFDKPIITQKRKPKTRTKRFYTEDELKKYTYSEILQILKHNNITREKNINQKKKDYIKKLIKKPIEIPNFIETIEREVNVRTRTFERKDRHEQAKKDLDKMIKEKKIQTIEEYKEYFTNDKFIYYVSNFGNYYKIKKKDNTQTKPKKTKRVLPGIEKLTGKIILSLFIRKLEKNEVSYYIDNNKNNNNVNNLLIVREGFENLVRQKIKKIKKSKKGTITKMKNAYVFRYSVNKNDFNKSFKTKEEAEKAQAEYQEKIDDIENPFNSLSILNLSFHSTKTTKKVKGKDIKGKEISYVD